MSCYSDEVLADTPLLYWPLDETQNKPTTPDASGNGLDGAFENDNLKRLGYYWIADSGDTEDDGFTVLDGSGLLTVTPDFVTALAGDTVITAIAVADSAAFVNASSGTPPSSWTVGGMKCFLYLEAPGTSFEVHGAAGAQIMWQSVCYATSSARAARLSFIGEDGAGAIATGVTTYDVPARNLPADRRWAVLINVTLGVSHDTEGLWPPVEMNDRGFSTGGGDIPFAHIADQGVFVDEDAVSTGVRSWATPDGTSTADVVGWSLVLVPSVTAADPGPSVSYLEVVDCAGGGCTPALAPEFSRFQDDLASEWVVREGLHPLVGLDDWTVEVWARVNPDVDIWGGGTLWSLGAWYCSFVGAPGPTTPLLRVSLGVTHTLAPYGRGIKLDCWNHVVVTGTAADEIARVYLNGKHLTELDFETFISGWPGAWPSSGLIMVGAAGDRFANFVGWLAQFALYDHALSPERIAAHFTHGCEVCRYGGIPRVKVLGRGDALPRVIKTGSRASAPARVRSYQ